MSEGSSLGDNVDQHSTPLNSSSSHVHHTHHITATDDDTLPTEVADLLQIRGDYEEVGSNLTLMSSEDQQRRDEALETFELEDIKEPEEEPLEVTELLQLKGDREEVGSNQSEVSEEAEKEREKDLQELLDEEAKEAEEVKTHPEDTLTSPAHKYGAIGIPTTPKVAIYYHVECTKHYIPDHPEQPARVKVILNAIQQRFSDSLSYREASYAKDEDIELFHTKNLIATFTRKWEEANAIYKKSKEVIYKRIDGDTKIMWGTKNAAYRAVGSVLDAIDHIYADPTDPLAVDTAFCCIRPPGHHAERNLSCGFCFFNNVAIGAKYAQHKYGVDKVAVLDFDVHHGNGTEEGFVPFENLFYASTHEKDNFPGTGVDPSPYVGEHARDPLHRRIVNRTLPGGPKSRGEFRIKWLQILKEMELFQPQLIIISAGFDAHDEDPLANVELIEEDYVWITKEILKSGLRINPVNPPKVFSVLEGGYDLPAIAKSATLHVQVLKEGYVKVIDEMMEENDPLFTSSEDKNHHGDEVAALREYLKDLGLN